ncbi:MAG TPA: hypothetical protein VL461_07055 [Dictyobacter sp.]|jgi:hypothetical protein|nr:hypothetical protein [Dictyobacter sp.]
MGQKDQKMTFTILGDTVYTKENRPLFWRNEMPLFWDTENMEDLALHTFPLIEDFEVLLEKMEIVPEQSKERKRCPFGYQICFFSAPRGYIATFPWWDHVEKDLRCEGFSIPLGTLNQPYSDLEQGWIISIATDDYFVYVVEGDFDRTINDHFHHTWFKVPKERYLSQWQKTIQLCQQHITD